MVVHLKGPSSRYESRALVLSLGADLNVTVLPLQNNIRENIEHPVVKRMDKFIHWITSSGV